LENYQVCDIIIPIKILWTREETEMNTVHKITFINLIAVMISSTAFAVTVPAGQYLPAASSSPTACPQNSYCTGGEYEYNENNAQGAADCPTSHPSSISGASSPDECYTPCVLTDVPNATAVTGNNYYGNGTDTCEATGCDNGYNLSGGTCTPEQIFVYQGVYIPAGTNTIQPCPANYYCPYDQMMPFDPDHDQNIFSCEDIENTNGAYPYSDEGSGSRHMCYKTCNNVNDFQHAITVSGRDYYDDDYVIKLDTCYPTSCDDGYHPIQGGVLNANGKPDISQIVGTAFINNNGEFSENYMNGEPEPKGQSYYGLSVNNSGAIDLNGLGLLNIRAYCSTTPGSTDNDTWQNPTTFAENALTDETGTTGANYCYCRIDSFTPTGQTKQNLNTQWVFLHDYEDSHACKDACIEECLGTSLGYSDAESEQVYFALYAPTNLWASPACVANTIDLTWLSDNVQYGNSTQCTYDGTIVLPEQPTKPGYTFTGWTVVP